MAILGWLATRFFAAGIGKSLQQARSFVIIALVIALVIALGVGGCMLVRSHDAGVIKVDDLEERAAGAERDLRGERAADNATVEGEAKFQAEQVAIKEGQNNAVSKDPDGARRSVGPSSRSYYDSLPEK